MLAYHSTKVWKVMAVQCIVFARHTFIRQSMLRELHLQHQLDRFAWAQCLWCKSELSIYLTKGVGAIDCTYIETMVKSNFYESLSFHCCVQPLIRCVLKSYSRFVPNDEGDIIQPTCGHMEKHSVMVTGRNSIERESVTKIVLHFTC